MQRLYWCPASLSCCCVYRETARPGAVTHSGDIMEFDQQKGANNAHINFAGLGPEVVEVFVTLSAWNMAVLSDIVQPYVQLKEPDTGGVTD